jgi:hypothetical protein
LNPGNSSREDFWWSEAEEGVRKEGKGKEKKATCEEDSNSWRSFSDRDGSRAIRRRGSRRMRDSAVFFKRSTRGVERGAIEEREEIWGVGSTEPTGRCGEDNR